MFKFKKVLSLMLLILVCVSSNVNADPWVVELPKVGEVEFDKDGFVYRISDEFLIGSSTGSLNVNAIGEYPHKGDLALLEKIVEDYKDTIYIEINELANQIGVTTKTTDNFYYLEKGTTMIRWSTKSYHSGYERSVNGHHYGVGVDKPGRVNGDRVEVDSKIMKSFFGLETPNQLWNEVKPLFKDFKPTPVYQGSFMEIDNVAVDFKGDSFIEGGSTYMAVRSLGETLGAKVDWDASLRRVTVTRGDIKMEVFIDSKTGNMIYTGDNSEEGMENHGDYPIDLSKAPIIRNGKTYLPLRDIADNLSYGVGWRPSTRTIMLQDYYGMGSGG